MRVAQARSLAYHVPGPQHHMEQTLTLNVDCVAPHGLGFRSWHNYRELPGLFLTSLPGMLVERTQRTMLKMYLAVSLYINTSGLIS